MNRAVALAVIALSIACGAQAQLATPPAQPATAMPAVPSGSGSLGTARTFWPSDTVMPSPVRAGTVVTATGGGFSVALPPGYSAPPTVSYDPYTKGVSCDVTVSTTTLSGSCYTAVYNSLGGTPTYTAAANVTVAYHLVAAN